MTNPRWPLMRQLVGPQCAQMCVSGFITENLTYKVRNETLDVNDVLAIELLYTDSDVTVIKFWFVYNPQPAMYSSEML